MRFFLALNLPFLLYLSKKQPALSSLNPYFYTKSILQGAFKDVLHFQTLNVYIRKCEYSTLANVIIVH